MKNKAFTVIELLVVIGIIALLLSILIPAISHVSDLNSHPQQPRQIHHDYPMPTAPDNSYTPETIKVEPLETANAPTPSPTPACTCNCGCCKK